jgi:hypothetical protein
LNLKRKSIKKKKRIEIEVLKKKRNSKESFALQSKTGSRIQNSRFFKDKGYPVTKLCEVLNISRSGYYKYKNRVKPEKEKQDELICSLINEYHSTFDGIFRI